jgi:FMN phosphatase YigB (HAD superfamily)
MLHNPGGRTNDALYNRLLSRSIGLPPERLAAITRGMIEDGLLDDLLARSFLPIPEGLRLVEDLARQGRYRQVVATSPAMPASFNRRRLSQAGFAPDWFVHVTGSDLYTSHKRERRFYDELLAHLGTTSDRCLMVGNDLGKDLYCRLAGIPMFLIENAWLHREKQPPGLEPNWSGSYDRLREGLEQGFPAPKAPSPAQAPSGDPA